jgi:hypothetical protein
MGVGKMLTGTPTDESSEPPRYDYCHPEITNFGLTNGAGIGKLHKRHTVSPKFIVWAFLDRSLAPLRLDEDTPAAVAKAAVAAPKLTGTC